MTTATALTTLAAFLGFAAAVYFVRGAIRLNVGLIHELASPRWDFHAGIARYLACQKTDYTFGAVLLLISFVAQAISIAPFEFNQTIIVRGAEIGFLMVALFAITLYAVWRNSPERQRTVRNVRYESEKVPSNHAFDRTPVSIGSYRGHCGGAGQGERYTYILNTQCLADK